MALEVIQRIDGATTGGISGTPSLTLATYTPAPDTLEDNLGGYASGGTRIYLKPEITKKKFVIAHEIGHWFQSNWAFGTIHGVDYDYVAVDPPCLFAIAPEDPTNAFHGLRSAEYTFGATVEGFAHMIATYAFNPDPDPDALFQYYKVPDLEEVPDYAGLVAGDYLVSMLAEDDLGGEVAWVQNQCPRDWNYMINGSWQVPEVTGGLEVTSSLEWVRFWWQFVELEISGTSRPNLLQVFQLMQLVEQRPKPVRGYGYIDYHEEISNSNNTAVFPYLSRFEDLAEEHGVYNGWVTP
jgi:hypothetical protein